MTKTIAAAVTPALLGGTLALHEKPEQLDSDAGGADPDR